MEGMKSLVKKAYCGFFEKHGLLLSRNMFQTSQSFHNFTNTTETVEQLLKSIIIIIQPSF